MEIKITTDNRELERAITATTRDQKKIMKKAYRKGAQPIVKLARRLLKSAFKSLIFSYRGTKYDLRKGIRTSIYKDGSGMSIYERTPFDPFYILLFHDFGAKNGRKISKNHSKYYKYKPKGGIKAKNFFQNAIAKQGEATDTIIKVVNEEINKKFN